MAVKQNYPSSGYGDDLAITAPRFGVAPNSSTLVSQAKHNFDHLKLGKKLPDSVFDWGSLLPGISIIRAQIYQSRSQLGGDS